MKKGRKKLKKEILCVMLVIMCIFQFMPVKAKAKNEIADSAFQLNTYASREVDSSPIEKVYLYLELGHNYLFRELKLEEEIYERGWKIDYQTPNTCDLSVTVEDKGNGILDLNFSANQQGEIDVYIKDYRGTVLYTYHVIVGEWKQKLYVGHPMKVLFMVDTRTNPEDQWEVVSSDENICYGEVKIEEGTNSEIGKASFYLTGLQEGTSVVEIKKNGVKQAETTVQVIENDNDVVWFENQELWNMMLENNGYYIDINNDGYISKEELAEVEYLRLWSSYGDSGYIDISGLEFAKNLKAISFANYSNILNLDVLWNLQHLEYIEINDAEGNITIDLDQFKIKDRITVNKGSYAPIWDQQLILLSKGSSTIYYDNTVSIEDLSTKYPFIYQKNILGKKVGTGEVGITVYSKPEGEVIWSTVTVNGIDENQPLNELSSKKITDIGKNVLVDAEGNLWSTDGNNHVIKENVNEVVAGWVYGLGREYVSFVLDEYGQLWNGDQIILKDVKIAKTHYALDENQVLYDIYCDNNFQVKDVKDWVEGKTFIGYDAETGEAIYQGLTYILKTNGTLWEREEGKSNSKLVQIADNVVSVGEKGYLKSNGEFYINDSWGGSGNVIISDAATIPGEYYYIGTDGNTYLGEFGWEEQLYWNIGQVNIVKALHNDTYNFQMGKYERTYYYLTDKGDLYQFTQEEGSQKIAENISDLIKDYYVKNKGMGVLETNEILYKDESGLYKNLSGETGSKEDPFDIVATSQDYRLQDYGVANDYNLSYHGVVLLTHVKNLFDNETDSVFVTRTDGGVWKIPYDGIPQKILNLEAEDIFMDAQQIQEIVKKISEAEEDEIIEIDMKSAMVIPQEVLFIAKEKQIILKCVFTNEIMWTINTEKISSQDLKDTDLSFIHTNKDNGSISSEIINTIAGKRPAEQLNFADGGNNLAATLTFPVDKTYEKMKCVAVGVTENTTKPQELLGVSLVENQKMSLPLSKAKDCALVYAVNGDTSGDGKVNIMDLMQTLHHVSGRSTFEVLEQGIADVDVSGQTNIMDLMKILHFVSGRTETL